jgi:uncharacterized protein with HEPN domain
MTPEDLIRIRHMLDAVKEALAFSRDKSREDLDNNRMLTLAIVKELEIIGEAASKLTPEFKATQPHIPWADIIGMRNRLTHGYFDIDLDRVWDTVLEDLGPLCKDLEKMVKENK